MTRAPIHPAALSAEQLLGQCRVRTGRRSGPGGQHRNKVETAVVITHLPSRLQGEATERRSQLRNREAALHRLRIRLALSVRRRLAEGEPLSALWVSRCRGGRLRVNRDHDDFPALLAEALDVLDVYDFDIKKAAARLEITPSQLAKLLKVHAEALQQVNRRREDLGRPPLR